MNIKLLTGLLGLLMLAGFLLPPLLKLKAVSLSLVIFAGLGLAAYEFYENLRENRD